MKWNQDHDLLWKLIYQDPIIFTKLPHWSSYWRREKSDSNKNEPFFSEDGMISEGSNYETDEIEIQQEVSPGLNQNEIRKKAKKLLWCRKIKAEVISKDIPALIQTKIYNHYKLFDHKMTNLRNKKVEENL